MSKNLTTRKKNLVPGKISSNCYDVHTYVGLYLLLRTGFAYVCVVHLSWVKVYMEFRCASERKKFANFKFSDVPNC